MLHKYSVFLNSMFIKEMVSWFRLHTHRDTGTSFKNILKIPNQNFESILRLFWKMKEGVCLSINGVDDNPATYNLKYLIEWTWTSLTVGIRLRLSPYTDHHCSSVCKVGVMQTCAPRGRREGDRALRCSEWMRLWMREMVTGSCPSLRMTSPGLSVWTYSRVTSSPTKQRGNFPEGHASNSPLTFKHL